MRKMLVKKNTSDLTAPPIKSAIKWLGHYEYRIGFASNLTVKARFHLVRFRSLSITQDKGVVPAAFVIKQLLCAPSRNLLTAE